MFLPPSVSLLTNLDGVMIIIFEQLWLIRCHRKSFSCDHHVVGWQTVTNTERINVLQWSEERRPLVFGMDVGQRSGVGHRNRAQGVFWGHTQCGKQLVLLPGFSQSLGCVWCRPAGRLRPSACFLCSLSSHHALLWQEPVTRCFVAPSSSREIYKIYSDKLLYFLKYLEKNAVMEKKIN